jgi:hypothetical protein
VTKVSGASCGSDHIDHRDDDDLPEWERLHPQILPRRRSETKQGVSLGLEWKKVRAAMWSGRDNGIMYTIKQRGDATFYVTRGIERSHFGSTRSLALAKNMAQDDATGHTKKRKKSS